MSSTGTKITLSEIDARIGKNRFVDIILGRNDILDKKASTDKIIADHGSVSAYLKNLFEFRQVNELYVDIFKPNGGKYLVQERLIVTNNNAIAGTDAKAETQLPNQSKKNDTMENKITGNESAGFYLLQNQFLMGQYNSLKSDYELLKNKYDKADDELRIARTDLSIASRDKEMAVLQGKNEASGTLGGVLKDATKPDNMEAIAKIIHAIKGNAPSSDGSSSSTIYKGMDQPQKDALNAMAEVIKKQSPEENLAMLEMAIRSSEDPNVHDFFQQLQNLQSQS